MKVIVVGAGLAGLTFALALQRSSLELEVEVYDKAKKLQHIGGGVIIWPQGLRYLEWLNLSDLLLPFKIPIEKCNIVGHQGLSVFSEDYQAFYELINGSILPIDRGSLQNKLFLALKTNTVKLNKACVRVESKRDKVNVYFQDGSITTGDLVIGADGIHSTIRKIFNNDITLEYSDYCWWGGIIKQKYLPELTPEDVHLSLGPGKMCVIWPAHGKHFMWYLPVKMPEENLKDKKLALSKLKDLLANWQPHLQPLIHHTIRSKKFHLPIFTLQSHQAWTATRMALIGDAAHALGPVLGQGISQAIEDVYVLINCLQKNGADIDSCLKQYENIRKPRLQKISALENWAAGVLIQETVEELEIFQNQLQHTSLASMYQDLIPLINQKSSLEVAELFS